MAAGSNSLNLILDDNSGAFQYGPFAWTSTQFSQYYGSEMMLPAFAVGITENSSTTSPYGSFSVTFAGISIAFVGTTPALASSQTLLVSIDGGTPYESSYDDTTPPSYVQWYQSPILAEGIHTVMVDQLAGTSLDYAIVTVGPNTPLTGMQVIVDNEDPAIQWSSSWALNTEQFDSAFLPDGFAYQNSTRQSSAAGDTMAFRFQGTSVSIYGIFSSFNTGMISATFTLDDQTIPQTYYVTPDDTVLSQGDAQNFLFMSYDNLLPQDHTLIVNVTRCVNQTFILDYITYTPSFSSLAEMDNLSTPVMQPSSATIPPLPTSTQLSPVSTISVGPNSTFTIPSPSVTPTARESSTADMAQSKRIPVAAVVSVAVTFFLFNVAFLFLCFRARSSRERSIKEEDPSPSVFPLLQITASNERRTYSGVPNRNQTYSPSGNVKMMPFPNYKQADLENSEITDKEQQDIYAYWSKRKKDVSSHTNETTNMPSSRQSALAPLRRTATVSLGEPSSSRRGTPLRPPPAYSAAVPRVPSAFASVIGMNK